MLTEIIAIYAITDDLLKAIGHQEDCRVQMSDAEVLTTALVAARFFNGHHHLAQFYWKEQGLVPKCRSTPEMRGLKEKVLEEKGENVSSRS